MNDKQISQDYRDIYARIMEIRKKEIPIPIETSFDIPHLVLANRRNTKTIRATYLSKLSIMVAKAFRITSAQHPVIPTIYLYGPQLVGEKQAVKTSILGRNWRSDDDDVLDSGEISINPERRNQFARDIPELKDIAEISLPLNDMIRMSYDLLFNRAPPTGSIKIEGLEAFSGRVPDLLNRHPER